MLKEYIIVSKKINESNQNYESENFELETSISFINIG